MGGSKHQGADLLGSKPQRADLGGSKPQGADLGGSKPLWPGKLEEQVREPLGPSLPLVGDTGLWAARLCLAALARGLGSEIIGGEVPGALFGCGGLLQVPPGCSAFLETLAGGFVPLASPPTDAPRGQQLARVGLLWPRNSHFLSWLGARGAHSCPLPVLIIQSRGLEKHPGMTVADSLDLQPHHPPAWGTCACSSLCSESRFPMAGSLFGPIWPLWTVLGRPGPC